VSYKQLQLFFQKFRGEKMNGKKLKLGLPKGSLQESTMELFRKKHSVL